jgi:hypothetical protein
MADKHESMPTAMKSLKGFPETEDCIGKLMDKNLVVIPRAV